MCRVAELHAADLDDASCSNCCADLQPNDLTPVRPSYAGYDLSRGLALSRLPLRDTWPAVLKGNDGNEIAFDKNDSNCSATKRRAKAEALKLIADKSVPGSATPTQYVDSALADIESYVASQPGPQGQIITIEDELWPAYSHYQACLNANAGLSAATAATIMSVFEQAMAACRSVRGSALVEGENALVKKGWDEAMRAKTAESTFATIDRLWMTRGQQLRESLLKQSR